jgi:hypothetical protein
VLSITKFGIFAITVCLFFSASSVYGHGLGIDTIQSVNIQGKKISISVEMSMYLDDDKEQIIITATEDETKENAKKVTFLIGLFHDDEMIFKNYFFAEDGILPIKLIPTQEGKVTIHGEQESLLGAWYGNESNPITIASPIFNSGGLYNFEIEIKTIDDPTNIIEDSGTYNADLSIIESTEFFQKDAKNIDVKFQVKSYFDKISKFEYDPEAKQVTFEMPFDWSKKQILHIPFVHEEVHFPNNFDEFLSGGYTGQVNGIDLFKASVTIDDYTEEDERIVHFVLLQDHLQYIKNQLEESDEPVSDKMIFTLSSSEDIEFPLTAYTNSEDFQLNLSWDPLEIQPGDNTMFIFTVRDGSTLAPLRNSDYTFVIIQNGKEIHRTSGVAQIGGGFEKFEFAEDQTGPTIIRFENIRNTGQETEFGFVVVPEFGMISVLIMGVSMFIVVFLGAKPKVLYNFKS